MELVRDVQVANWLLEERLGARAADISRWGTKIVTVPDFDNDFVLDELLGLDRGFEGAGFTFSLGGRRPLEGANLSLVFDLRGSVLWGHNQVGAKASGFRYEPDGAGNMTITDSDTIVDAFDDQKAMWIGEVQLGLQWRRPIHCLGMEVFASGLVEYQSWSYGKVSPDYVIVPGLGEHREQIGFFGATSQVGFLR